MMIVLATLQGALLVPAIFAASEGDKFFNTWGNPLTFVAVGALVGVAWVQLVAFPAALVAQSLGGRGGFAETRTAVAISMLPTGLLLFGYWLVRLTGQAEAASLLLVTAWPLATLLALRNLRRGLAEIHRTSRTRAAVSAGFANTAGVWISLLIGLVPFLLTFLAILVQSKLWD